MPKIYSEADLSDYFDRELIWRRKELSDIKHAVTNASDGAAKSALLKALLAMSYAHWEGYVKESALAYFGYITIRRMKFSDLVRQYYVNAFIHRLDALAKSKASLFEKCELVDEIVDGGDKRFSYIKDDLVDTRSNLNTDVMREICVVCDVDHAHFEGKRTFLDVVLLKRRNAVSHGQDEVVREDEADDLVSDVLALMAHFRTLLENKIYQKGYLVSP